MRQSLTLQTLLPPARRAARHRVRWRRLIRAVHPVLGQAPVMLAILGTAWIVLYAVNQYSAQKATTIAAETDRFVHEFRSEPVVSSWRRLSEVWQAELPRQRTLLTRNGDADPMELTRRFRPFLMETIVEEGLQREIETVLAYFRRLALCVRMGSCDPHRIAANLGDLPQRFRNQHHLYLQETHPGEDVDRYFALIRQG